MRIAQGPSQARGAEALLSARGARREARLGASARLRQPCYWELVKLLHWPAGAATGPSLHGKVRASVPSRTS